MTNVVASNIALVSLAPQGIAQLRALILDLAIRGRLTTAHEDDEPAANAIARIDQAKNSHLTKPELARLDTLAMASFDEQRFPLPANWQWRRLGAIGVVASSSRVHQKDWTTKGVPFYRTREIVQLSNNGSVTPDLFISEALFDELVARSPGPAAGDIMITGVGTIGVPYVVRVGDRFYFKDASVLIFKNYFGFSPDYLALFFKSPWWRETIHKESMGTTVHTLTIGRANDVLVPIPPVEQQKRIVAKVGELMVLCDRLEARQQDAEAAHTRLVQALLDSLTQARDADEFQACWQRVAGQFEALFTSQTSVELLSNALLSMAVSGRLVAQSPGDESAELLLRELDEDAREFCERQKAPRAQVSPIANDGVPFKAPSGWAWARLGSVFRVITDGDHQAPPQTDEGIAFLTIGNVTNGYVNFDQCRSVEPRYFAGLAPYRKPAAGDLLYTVVGATYGRPVLVETDRPFCVQRHIAILKRSEHLCARFALCLLKSPLIYDQASAAKTGTAQPTIPLRPLRNLLVPLPPLAEQGRIVAKVTELLALCDQLKARIAAARAKHAQLAAVLVEAAVA